MIKEKGKIMHERKKRKKMTGKKEIEVKKDRKRR